jgi:hypothetical protein
MKGRAIPYSEAELLWVRGHRDLPRKQTHAAFVERFNRPDVSLSNYNSLCKRNGWFTGRTGCFQKGLVPHNKGKPMPPEVRAKCMATAFKPGQLPHNHRGHGHERVDSKDGYVVMIVAETNPWTGADTRPVHKHRYLWEQVNGPIPADHVLKCLDGDKTNTDPSNWEAVPRSMLPKLNARWSGVAYDSAPAELRPVIMATAKLDHAAREARKRKAG